MTWTYTPPDAYTRIDDVRVRRLAGSPQRPWAAHRGNEWLKLPITGARAKYKTAEAAMKAAGERWPLKPEEDVDAA